MGIKDFFNELVKWLKEAFGEDDGSASSSRLLAGMVVISVLGWVTYFLVKHGAIPDLNGPSLFLSSGTSATYGLNQAKQVMNAWKGNGNGGNGNGQPAAPVAPQQP